jgi:excisionase family DNA binding protein
VSRLMKIVEAAEILGISRSKTYEMAKMRRLPVTLIDGCVRIPEDKLKEWIKENTIIASN